MIELKYHPFVSLFPRMEKEEFEQFKLDIAVNGLYIPILVLEGTDLIIDGRHRYEACCLMKVELRIEYFSGNENRVLGKIVSLNSRRRHLSESQRAAIAADLANMSSGTRTDLVQICTRLDKKSLQSVAEDLNISRRSVAHAKAVKNKLPETWELIRSGEVSVADAYNLRDEPEEVIEEAIQRYRQDKEAKRKPKKLVQYRKEIKQEAAKKLVEKATNSLLGKEVNISLTECPRVNFGDVWQLGNHTLTCCDSATWNAPQAKLAFADPPYNAGMADWDMGFEWNHDWLIDKAEIVVITPGDESLSKFLQTTTMPYKCMIAHWIKNGMSKSPMGYGNHIIAAVFCKESSPYKVTGKRNQNYSEGIIKPVETDDTDHPGRKPLDFVIVWIDRLTNAGEIIIDPFLGSGTTLIAAEETGRICHGAEINPEYCGFILGKWIKAGKEAPRRISRGLDIRV
jgi:16S rRNA G966 N2-methylase RsmD